MGLGPDNRAGWIQSLTPEFNAFRTFIEHETQSARLQAMAYTANLDTLTVACIDPKTKTKGSWNPPGGVIFLSEEGLLEEFMSRRASVKGNHELVAHLYCGYMFIERGLTTIQQQKDKIAEVRAKVETLNRQFQTSFFVPTRVEEIGGAMPFMTDK